MITCGAASAGTSPYDNSSQVINGTNPIYPGINATPLYHITATASPPGGYYDTPQNVDLEAYINGNRVSENTTYQTTIYYTLDGSDPSINSAIYRPADYYPYQFNPITIPEGTTVLKFMARTAMFPYSRSQIFQEVYYINANPGSETNTGDNVSVALQDPSTSTVPVDLTFENISESGYTSLKVLDSVPELPSGFMVDQSPTFYEIETTAAYSGPINISVNYSGTFENESALRLLHCVNGAWEDCTTSIDIENHVIYGTVSSLSPFAIIQQTDRIPTAVPDGPYVAYEGSPITFDGSASTDPDGDSLSYKWDLDGDGIFETTGMTVTKIWNNDYSGIVSLKVTNTKGVSNIASTTVNVLNVAPTANISDSYQVAVPITMRISGAKGNSVEIQVIQDGQVIASQKIIRDTTSPNDQEVTLVANIDMSKPYTGRVIFDTVNDSNGATPVWLIIDGKKTKVATFNTQKTNPSTYHQTHDFPLTVLFTVVGKEITFSAEAMDPGTDEITFKWTTTDNSNSVTHVYTSDGVNPITDTVNYTFTKSGDYIITLTVRDQDGAEQTYSKTFRII